MTVDTKEVVTTIAYMIGVRKSALESSYPECTETIEKLYAGKEATVIRYLCKLRTVLMQKFKRTDTAIRFELKNLNSLDWYDHDNIRQLQGNDSHKGKRPAYQGTLDELAEKEGGTEEDQGSRPPEEEIRLWERRLKEALRLEEYETAALCRDKIKELKEGKEADA